jgi:hypothetical protein
MHWHTTPLHRNGQQRGIFSLFKHDFLSSGHVFVFTPFLHATRIPLPTKTVAGKGFPSGDTEFS